MPSCKPCAAGRYQNKAGQTSCRLCIKSSWCAAGSSAPTPCDPGTVGKTSGLGSAAACSECPPGKWCSAGVAIPCATGTWSNVTNRSNMGACRPCPARSWTQNMSSTSVADCLCEAGRYSDTRIGGEVVCTSCPQPGSNCDSIGVTLAALPVASGYWRSGNASEDLRVCPTYGQVDGDKRCVGTGNAAARRRRRLTEGGYSVCADKLFGVYCTQCPLRMYLDSDTATCESCDDLGSATRSVVIVAGVVVSVLLLLLLCSRRIMSVMQLCLKRIMRIWQNSALIKTSIRRALTLAEATGLAAKGAPTTQPIPHQYCASLLTPLSRALVGKVLISFYQMATCIQSVFGITFPTEVQTVLAVFETLVLNLFELGLPTECFGLGTFQQRILFMLISPLALMIFTLPISWWLLREEGGMDDNCVRSVGLGALTLSIKLLFLVFPLVSATAVQAFNCEHFDTGELWLQADVCRSPP